MRLARLTLSFAFFCQLAFQTVAQLPDQLRHDFSDLRWVAYSPSAGDPSRGHWASEADLQQDLDLLAEYGFDGLVTYSTMGTLAQIPRLATDAGFKRVILGVWDPISAEEIERALSVAQHVDAFCLGNENLGHRYSMEDLRRVIGFVKSETGKPVTTSEELADYHNIGGLLALGDWAFPNAHPFWARQVTSEAAVEWTLDHFAALRAREPGRVVMFKEVGYPTSGDTLANEAIQADYFRLMRETHVPFVHFEAFDQLWKGSGSSVEKHWGLFDASREPKRAALDMRRGEPTRLAQNDESAEPESDVWIKFEEPVSKGKVMCKLAANGGLIEVEGKSAGHYGTGKRILLYVNPQHPAANGYFLQLPPQGILDFRPDGSWKGQAQLGNRTYPPDGTEIITLAVVVVDETQAKRLIDDAKEDPGTPRQGLPQVGADSLAIAQDVDVEIEH